MGTVTLLMERYNVFKVDDVGLNACMDCCY